MQNLAAAVEIVLDDQVEIIKMADDKYICEICGTEMYGKHCKLRCPNCNNFLDCSDIYLDSPRT